MKKTLAGVLAIAVLSAGSAQAADKQVSKVVFPDLKSQKTVTLLKKGIFAAQTIKIGDPYSKIYQKFGTPASEYESRSEEWAYAVAEFNKISFSAESDNRKIATNDMKINTIYFDYASKPVKLKDIQSVLGKYTASDMYDNDTKDPKDDILSREYGHLSLDMERPKGEWIVTGASMNEEVTYAIDPSNLKDAEFATLKSSELKAMKAGTYSFFGVKPGMLNSQIVALIGESSSDDIFREKGKVKEVTSTYGSGYDVTLHYNIPAGNTLKKIQYNYDIYENVQTLSTVEKYLGKATSVKNSSYTEETEEGNEIVYTTTRQYGKHVTIKAVKQGKVWQVESIIYK
ncbi:hypothetical protein [Macrococcus brunensis]|uniref:hypothetical protein n=1 Tax=Macrococcus brunensis TaxID=198483 RepID=UPI001EF12C12|nr:hypothetical protein [Macrococcus brunensis]ULG73773.1 hypothetical protein MGG13_08785 [Macrococcus brunensis]